MMHILMSDKTQPGAKGITAHPARLNTIVIIGAIIGVVGALIGALGGILLTTYLSNYPFALFSGLIPVITVRLSAFPFPMFIGFIISIFASIYPAWLASRYQPEEAMRYV